jgi:hypothetical protein
MSFDAGTVEGRLNLNTTQFKDGFSEAHTHAETEGGRIREVLESITEVFSEALGPAVGQFANQLQSAFAGFSEGGIIGSLNAIGIGAGFIRESVEGAAEEFHKMGIESEKLGVPVEFFSRLAAVGKSVAIAPEQLAQAFVLLNVHAAEAVEGNKEAERGFGMLGISASELTKHLTDTKWIVQAVLDGLDKLPEGAARGAAAHDLLGRSGAALIPLLSLGNEEIKRRADLYESLGGVTTETDAEIGKSWGQLEAQLDALEIGIKRAFAEEVLKAFQQHMQEIEWGMRAIGDEAAKIPGAMVEAAKTAEFLKSTIAGDINTNHSGWGQAVKGAWDGGWGLEQQWANWGFNRMVHDQLGYDPYQHLPKGTFDQASALAFSGATSIGALPMGLQSHYDEKGVVDSAMRNLKSGLDDVIRGALGVTGQKYYSDGNISYGPSASSTATTQPTINITVQAGSDHHAIIAAVNHKLKGALSKSQEQAQQKAAGAAQQAALEQNMAWHAGGVD